MPILDLAHQGLDPGAVPKHWTFPYKDTDGTIKRMYDFIEGPRGEKSLRLRLTIEEIIRGINPRDKLSQLVAIYHWFNRRFHFVNDPIQVELVKDPERLLEEISARGIAIGDCDDASTFLGAAPRTLGIPTRLVRTGFRDVPKGRLEGPFTHVLVVAQDQWKRPIVLDPVAGRRSREMLGRVRQYKF